MTHTSKKSIPGRPAIALAGLAIALALAGCPSLSTPVAAPTFSPAAGTYGSDQSVSIACSTTGATIYYTTDGTDPNTASAVFSAPIAVAGDGTSMTIKALAVLPWTNASAVEASYAIHYPGALDTEFPAAGVGANDSINTIAIQSDGKLLIGGRFTAYGGVDRGYVARLAGDGSLDTTFLAAGAGLDGYVIPIAVQSNGKILIGGSFSAFNGTSRGHVARLKSDGTLDTAFLATGTGADGDVYSIALQTDGKILIGGHFLTYNGTSCGCVARLNTDGSLDTTFPALGGVTTYVYSVTIQSDGKILIGGYDILGGGFLIRLGSDGTPDAAFTSAVAASNLVFAVALQSDGKILVGGLAAGAVSRGYLARLNTDGTLDTGFLTTGSGPDNYVGSIALQTDGKILIGGSFGAYNDTGRGRIARLNADGSLDTSFLTTAVGANSYLSSIALQSDGKILIAGNFNTYNGTTRGRIARVWN